MCLDVFVYANMHRGGSKDCALNSEFLINLEKIETMSFLKMFLYFGIIGENR